MAVERLSSTRSRGGCIGEQQSARVEPEIVCGLEATGGQDVEHDRRGGGARDEVLQATAELGYLFSQKSDLLLELGRTGTV